jgi:hypothetical protein
VSINNCFGDAHGELEFDAGQISMLYELREFAGFSDLP